MNKPWMALILMGTLAGTLISTNLQASTEQNFSDDPLAKRCIKMLDIYATEDFDAYVAEFPEPWLGIFGEKTLRKQLADRHGKYVKEYQAKPDTIKIKAVTPAKVAKIEQDKLGALEAKEIDLYIASNKGNSSATACKYLRIGDSWYFRSLRL
ncbi:hypothetical protein K0I63_03290 [Shewanella rhizosphaerae]|uniref:hypothetical protein n=1 Tax=Shewanella rhizosphaerae TaxID=2864207 RepID=UPI001C655014|nr:hypothetical protein [Shewanella rhizosphaerae]QYK13554.1 hypothetical protein K0I63_03290 [Shewanella rhizosphaerae]